MSSIIDLTGRRFGRLVVISKIGYSSGHLHWLCICDCKNEHKADHYSLTDGDTKSCGCLRTELIVARSKKHGHAGRGGRSSEHASWTSMLNRCTNKSTPDYKEYGERGIDVCDRWLKFENFIEDMGYKPSLKHSLDRIDNNKGYYPENCRWATAKEQANNRRSNVSLTFDGKTMSFNQWSERTGLPARIIYRRVKFYGWPAHKALTTPVEIHNRNASLGSS
jgi:hypothetical protein